MSLLQEILSIGSLNPGIGIAIIFVFIILIFILFTILSLKRKKLEKQETAFYLNSEKIKEPRKRLLAFGKQLKDFLKKILNEQKEFTYSEISQRLRKMKKIKTAELCEKINYYLYSEQEIKIEEIKKLEEQFKNIAGIKKPEEKKQETPVIIPKSLEQKQGDIKRPEIKKQGKKEAIMPLNNLERIKEKTKKIQEKIKSENFETLKEEDKIKQEIKVIKDKLSSV